MTDPTALLGWAADAASVAVPTTPLPADLVVEGTPETGVARLGTLGDAAVGVWVHTPGVSNDEEADEVFIVLTGDATLETTGLAGHPDAALPEPVVLRPGVAVRLVAGQRTRWSIRETLRKLYVS